MSPYHPTSLPTPDGLPSRGLFDPLQGPSSENHRLSPTSLDGRPVRLRGSVSVPIVPAPTGATAASLSESRCREASRSGVRVAPVSPSSPRSRAVRANEHSKRHVHGASRASRASRIVTDAGRPCDPSRGACRIDVAIAFDGPERCHSTKPEGSRCESTSAHRCVSWTEAREAQLEG